MSHAVGEKRDTAEICRMLCDAAATKELTRVWEMRLRRSRTRLETSRACAFIAEPPLGSGSEPGSPGFAGTLNHGYRCRKCTGWPPAR